MLVATAIVATVLLAHFVYFLADDSSQEIANDEKAAPLKIWRGVGSEAHSSRQPGLRQRDGSLYLDRGETGEEMKIQVQGGTARSFSPSHIQAR